MNQGISYNISTGVRYVPSRANSQGTLYKRDGVYYANYSRNGKQVRVSLHTKIKSIALEKFHELIEGCA